MFLLFLFLLFLLLGYEFKNKKDSLSKYIVQNNKRKKK